MWTLTGFADEASPDFEAQLSLLNRLRISHLEFRSAWGTKICDLSDDQVDEAERLLASHGVKVSSIGSDLGKITITDDFEPHLARTRRAVELAQRFGSRYIRVFSFFLPEGDEPGVHRDEVLRRTRAMVEIAAEAGVTLLHENEKHIYGDTPERVVDLISSIDSPHYRGILDPANYVQCHVRPFDEAWPQVAEFTDYIHCKDALASVLADGIEKVVPCGEGDGQVREISAALQASGFDGFFSIEPHLGSFDEFGGQCGPELWTTAHTALTSLFTELGVDFR